MILALLLLAAAGDVQKVRVCDKTNPARCATVDAAGAVSIGGTISASSSVHSTASAPTYVEATDNPFSSDLAGSLRIVCMGGTCGGASPFADNAAFTAGTTSVSVVAGVFNDSITALTSGSAGAPRLTSKRAIHFNLRDNSGNEIPFPAALAASGGMKVDVQNASIAVTGTVAVSNSFALDATLTGGTQKAIVRGGAKGATAAADVTSTANGVDHQGLDVQVQNTVTVSGTVTTTPPSNASTNVAQLNGTTTDTNSGVKSAGTLRVVLATDQPALTNKLLVTPDSVALPANQSVDLSRVAGTATDVNSGNKSAGTIRVVLATDQPALTNKLLVTPDSVALPANQSVNVSQINAVTPLMGNGTTGTGSQRVTIASDNTAFAVNAAATQGAGNTANPWAVQGTVADGVNIAGNPVPVGYKSVAVASAPTTVTAGQETYGIGAIERIPYVRTWHPNLIACNVAVSTATTITAFGGSCAAPGANLSVYITDITASASAASGTAADSMLTIKSGTGGTCGTATAVLFEQFNPANGGFHASFQTPIRVAANSEVCWIDSTAGSKTLHIQGFIAP